jgi:hypothetical protein
MGAFESGEKLDEQRVGGTFNGAATSLVQEREKSLCRVNGGVWRCIGRLCQNNDEEEKTRAKHPPRARVEKAAANEQPIRGGLS